MTGFGLIILGLCIALAGANVGNGLTNIAKTIVAAAKDMK